MNAATDRDPSERDHGERDPSSRSLRALDWLNFSMADVANGLGAYLAVFLKGGRHWNASDIGLALAVSTIAGALSQVPMGMLVDAARIKRLLVAGFGVLIACGCMAIALHPTLYWVIGAQVVIGVASAIMPPALAALCLGLVGRRRMPKVLGRNQGFNHAGAFTAAILIGVGGHYWGYDWIFYLVCLFALGSVAAVFSIRPNEIDHELARGGEAETDGRPMRLRELLRYRDLIVFLASVMLFHFSNAGMLPMAAQVIARAHPGSDTIALSACVVVAQAVMIVAALAVGRALDRGSGRKIVFIAMYAMVPLRGLLFALLNGNTYAVVGIEVLDGVANGIFSVIAVIVASDLMRGTGRFNLAQGLVALSVGLGAGLSNLTGGYVVQWFGYPAGFFYLAGIGVVGLAVFALLMPETRGARSTSTGPGRAAAAA